MHSDSIHVRSLERNIECAIQTAVRIQTGNPLPRNAIHSAKRSPDEDLLAGALRELVEETGYAPAPVDADNATGEVRYLGVVWDNPALGTMQSHLYVAWNLVLTDQPRRDPAEFVTLHWVSVDWLKEAVRSGVIKDRVVVAAVAYLVLNGLIR